MNWFKKLFAPKHTDANGFTWTYEYPYWWIQRSYNSTGYALYYSVLDEKQELSELVQERMAENTKGLTNK